MSRFAPGFRSLPLFLATGLTLLPIYYANAQTSISTSQAGPVQTSKTGDLTIVSGAAVNVGGGPAVIVNSNNTVDNQGAIAGNNGNNMTGILVTTGATGTITNDGTITVSDTNLATTIPLTGGLNRFGIQIAGPSPFIGTITNSTTGSITVRGNNSAGIYVNTGGVTGAIAQSGTIGMTGNNSFGILTNANAPVTGSITVAGAITSLGTGAGGIALHGAVGGEVDIDSTVQATGFYNNGVTTARPTTFDGLSANNFLLGGSAVSVTSNVGGGILVDTGGDVVSYGSAPALIVAPAAGGSSTIGATTSGAAIGIDGAVHANGIYDGISATGVQIGGGGGTVSAISGLEVAGSVNATSYAANATGITIGAGATLPALENTGTIQSIVNFGAGGLAATGGTSTAILDTGGALSSIINKGTISATTAAGSANALDLRGDTVMVTLTQLASPTTTASSITGNVLFGAAGGALNLDSGTLTGTVSFGDSLNNALSLANGAVLGGGIIQASGGQLALDIVDGRLSSNSTTGLRLSSLTIGSAGQIDFALDPITGKNGSASVVGAMLFATGAKIGVNLDSQLTAPQTITVIQTVGTTGALVGQPSLLLGDVPYFYAARLITDPNAGTIGINIRDRTFAEAGVLGSASAYKAVFAASYIDPSIRDAFNAAGTQAGFKRIYQQMLPSYSGGLFEVLQDGADALVRAQSGNPVAQAGGRTGGWAQQFGFGAEQSTNSAPGYHGGGLGFAFGYEMPASAISSWGISVSYMRASADDFNTGPNNQEVGTVYSTGVYWREAAGGFHTDASINAGVAELNSARNFAATDLTGAAIMRSADAAWTGGMANAHLGVSYEEPLGDFYVKPSVSGDYFMLFEGSHAEHSGGSGFDLNVGSSSGKQGSVTGGLAFGMALGDRDFSWRPEVMVGYKQVFGGPDSVTAAFASGPSFALSPASQQGGAIARIGVHGGNQYSDFAFEAGGEDRGDYRSFDGRIVARFQF